MARITHVAKSQPRKNGQARHCRKCGNPIEVGKPYKWFSSRIGRTSRRSDYHAGCEIPRSHTTSSAQLQTLYDALDAAEQEINQADDFDGIEGALQTCADSVREAGEMYTESADNMEDGFGTATSISDEIREKGEMLEEFASELESVDLDEFEEEEARSDAEQEIEDEAETPEGEDYEQDDDAVENRVEEKRQEWLEEQKDKAQSAISESPM